MKAALGGLALACALFLGSGNTVFAARVTNTPLEYAGAPFSTQARGYVDENQTYATMLDKAAYELIMVGAYHDAEGRLRQALLFEPGLVSARCNLGYVLNRTGRAAEALPHLLYAYKLAPGEPAVMQSLAASYQLCGKYLNAVAVYRQYLARFPNANDAWYISGITKHLEAEQASLAAAAGSPKAKTDSLSWGKKVLRVYVKNADGVKGYQPWFNEALYESFNKWGEAGVLSFDFVDSPKNADIECDWIDDSSKLSSIGEGGEALVNRKGSLLTHAKVSLLTSRLFAQGSLTREDVEALCLHEIGHALGLMDHSNNPNDVMFSTLANAHNPSAHDIDNLHKHYLTR